MRFIIRECNPSEFTKIYEIINSAALVYKGVIPADCWTEPYMSETELQHEIDEGVVFWGYEEEQLAGVMGIQQVRDVTLFRHAYILPTRQRQGIGEKLLSLLKTKTNLPILIGTWSDATWAVSFYKKHGFRMVAQDEKNQLLKKYWSISERQIATSVVLVEKEWFDSNEVI